MKNKFSYLGNLSLAQACLLPYLEAGGRRVGAIEIRLIKIFMGDMGIMDMGILGVAEKHLSEASHSDVSNAPPGS